MSEITPITREEKLWNGEDLEPLTREEMYIKRIFDKTQTIPDKPLTRKEILMEKAGEGGGGDVTIKQLSVTANGTYSEEGTAYSPVNVAVPLAEKSVTENGTYNASDDSVAGYSKVNVNVPLPENAYLLKEASGSLVSFSDGADLPMPSFICNIDAVQDLHGYDVPWVGGSGKNKLKVTATTTTKSGVTFTVKEDGTIVVTGTKSSSSSTNIWLDIAFNISFSEDVILNGCPSGGSSATYKLAGLLGSVGYGDYIDTGSGVTIPANTTLNTISIGIAQQGNISLVFKPMIRLASVSDSTFAPYSNECPISGWDEANVTRCGVNVWDEEWVIGTISSSTGEYSTSGDRVCSKNYIRVEPNTLYYKQNFAWQFYYDEYKNFISLTSIADGVFTTPNNAHYMKFYTSSVYGQTYNNDISINYPSTDTSYHAYNGQTYTIDLDGTRYGGTLDVVSGVLTVEKQIVDLGSLSWSVISERNGIFGATVNGLKTYSYGNTPDMLCSVYKITPSSYNDPYISANGIIWTYVGVSAIRIKDTAYSDATAFKTAVTGQKLVYELATPQTYQLTPTQIKSLLGSNIAWCDTGDVDIDYFAKEVTG